MLGPRRKHSETDRDREPADDDEPYVTRDPVPEPADRPEGAQQDTSSEHGTRASTSDAGQRDERAKSHWFAATSAARSRNQGLRAA